MNTDLSTPGTVGEVRVETIAPLSHAEAEAISTVMVDGLVRLLRSLEPSDWDKPTDCELWSVRDHLSHQVGWHEALVSMKEMGSQGIAAFKRVKELGNLIDAQNQVQVDTRRDVPTNELIDRLEELGPKAARRRAAIGKTIGRLPFYMTYMGGWINVTYLTDAIFPRDIYMHRVDIARATGKKLETTAADQRLIEDIVRDWFKRTGADARLVLTGDAGGTYVGGTPIATLTADAIEFTRFLFGRVGTDIVKVEGDEAAATRWLSTFFPV